MTGYSFDCLSSASSRHLTEQRTTMYAAGVRGFFRGIKTSVVAAAILLAWDAVIGAGTFMTSMLICPIWFFVNLVRFPSNRSDWGVALIRIGIPASMFGLVLANNNLQLQVAESRAQRVIAACMAYHAANGKFPDKLDELVPKYMTYVPSARYCPGPWSQFRYYNGENPSLFWYIFPPYDRKIYNFNTRRWSYMN